MALEQIPGLPGYAYGVLSSMDRRAIGKFTDSNHLSSLWSDEPAMYDKKIIEMYTQTSLVANDFLDMLNMSTPFYINGNSDSFQWEVEVPFEFKKVLEIPSTTNELARIGIDQQPFELVFDTNEWAMNSIIGSDLKHGPQFTVVKDPVPWNGGWLYVLTLNTENPRADFVDRRWIQPGTDYQLVSGTIGEFDQDLLGLPGPAKKLKMFESLGSAIGWEHTITGWADARTLRDSKTGAPLDLTWYVERKRNAGTFDMKTLRWEPTIERMLRQEAISLKVKKMIWQKPGTAKSNNSRQEVKKISAGLYPRLRQSGNYVPINPGESIIPILRSMLGDLFYRRVAVGERRAKIYTNEAGFEKFETDLKADAMGQGFTFNVGDNDKFVQGSGQNLVMNYAFSSMITRETGKVNLVHLKELDLPQTNVEFGQNKKSTPLYMIFDLSPEGDGTLRNNIREVRVAGQPSMKWGYIDGRTHHLGFAASKGHSMATKFDGYTITMDDRYDVFVEDPSRTAIIEQVPQF